MQRGAPPPFSELPACQKCAVKRTFTVKISSRYCTVPPTLLQNGTALPPLPCALPRELVRFGDENPLLRMRGTGARCGAERFRRFRSCQRVKSIVSDAV